MDTQLQNSLLAKIVPAGFNGLADVAALSFREFRNRVRAPLSWHETKLLHRAARDEKKENLLYKSRLLSRASPLLQGAKRLGIKPPCSALYDYQQMFGGRATQYVAPGSAASMFSPAAYLTEMYREAGALRAASSLYHIDVRRPDLQGLTLSQKNLDEEISVLTLSNEVLMTAVQKDQSLADETAVLQLLSTCHTTGETPYHEAFERIRQSITIRDPDFGQLMTTPDVIGLMSEDSLLGMRSAISPELFAILVQEVTEENATTQFPIEFGNTTTAELLNVNALKAYFVVDDEVVQWFIYTYTLKNYIADRLLYPTIDAAGNIVIGAIVREYTHSPAEFNYAALIPLGGDAFEAQCNFTVGSTTHNEFEIQANGIVVFLDTSFYPLPNQDYRVPISLADFDLTRPVVLRFLRRETGQNANYADCTCTWSSAPPERFLLDLNKSVRMQKSTALRPIAIDHAIWSASVNMTVDATSLRRLMDMHYYMARYSLDHERALVLCNANISRETFGGQPSQFDRLFNTPPLNGFQFTPDGATVDLNPTGSTDDPRKAVLKRANHADDVTLYRLLKIADYEEDGSVTNDIALQSDLYLTSTIADTQSLSVDDLALLLAALGESTTKLVGITDSNLRRLVDRIDGAMRWLISRKWSVRDLFIMTTTNYPATLTAEVQSFIDSLNSELRGTTLVDDALISAMAPYAAASLRMESQYVAQSLLTWIDELEPNGMGVDAFWSAIKDDAVPSPEAIQFCHALAQLALVFQGTRLDANSLFLLVTMPNKLVTLKNGATVAGHDAATLMELTKYTDWMTALGANEDQILTSLTQNALTPVLVAKAMNLDEELLIQAGIQAFSHGQILTSDQLQSWPETDITLQWIEVARILGVSPQAVSDWLALDYLPPPSPSIDFTSWNNVATTLTAGLQSPQATDLENLQNQSLSSALSTFYLEEVANSSLQLHSRNELYSYLLLDNQVAGDVKSTRIAEAIASTQLYVNRALDRLEPEVETTVITRPYFMEWGKYNKRYSTWAGLSELVYYPENYIDPTLRNGQSNMMDGLLQSINQSHLKSNVVEAAFKSYLSSFEQIANLDIISGYHDASEISHGLTYFIGINRSETPSMYWRSVDHALERDGVFPANAWTDWKSIGCAMNVHQNVIRPVLRKSRLHFAWLERVEQASTQTDGSVATVYRHQIKVSYLHYDGSWSSPLNYPADVYLDTVLTDSEELPGLYCAESSFDDSILVMLYNKQTQPEEARIAGFYIYLDYSSRDMEPEEADAHQQQIYQQLDSDVLLRVNNRYPVNLPDVAFSVEFERGDFPVTASNISKVYGGQIRNIEYVYVEGKLNSIKFSPVVVTAFELFQEDPEPNYYQRRQFETMVDGQDPPGTWFQIPKFISISPVSEFCTGMVVSVDTNENGRAKYHTDCPQSDLDGVEVRLNPGNAIFMDCDPTTAATVEYGPTPLTKTQWTTIYGDRAFYGPVDFGDQVISVTENTENLLKPNITPSYIQIIIDAGDQQTIINGENLVVNPPAQSWGTMQFDFSEQTLDVSDLKYENGQTTIEMRFEVTFESGHSVGKELFSIPLYQYGDPFNGALSLGRDSNNAQYFQWGPYRVRMNTLFARQLTARAAQGLDTILSLDSQHLPEPQLGHGGYVNVVFPPYDPAMHGSERNVIVQLYSGDTTVPAEQAFFPFLNITLSDSSQNVTLFVPVSQRSFGYPVDFPFTLTSGIGIIFLCNNTQFTIGTLQIDSQTLQPMAFVKDPGWNVIRDPDILMLEDYVEPMDFNGANALYFWELFYYTPMLVAQRLALEHNFEETQRWLEYVWRPAGYVINDELQTHVWNVRPLEEDLSWNSEPLASTDPDAVAQYDPMHYKVATFMRTLDLLLARGDYLYRQLERDSLNEAKLWYVEALNLLGERPYVPLGDDWNEPSLAEAASLTLQSQTELAIAALRLGLRPEPSSANTVAALFLPQANDLLLNYWQTFEQRLFNLRHNLTIDGKLLSLPIFAKPADPKSLQASAMSVNQDVSGLPTSFQALWRFTELHASASTMVAQLIQIGSTLQGLMERKENESLDGVMHEQAAELMRLSLSIQDTTIAEIDAERAAVERSREGALRRLDSYRTLYDENINAGEQAVMDLRMTSGVVMASATALHMASAALDMVPNIYGLAVGGARFGALFNAGAIGSELAAAGAQISADKISQSEVYRRRRQEWEIQRNNSEAEVKNLDAQLRSLSLRREAAEQQKTYMVTQQRHLQAQQAYLKSKFTSAALYSWLSGRISTLYYQIYDLTLARCLMAETAFHYHTGEATSFFKPGAWQGTYGGLSCGESLQLSLARMNDAYLRWEGRALEVTRTQSLSMFYAALTSNPFDLATKVAELVEAGSGNAGTPDNGIKVENGILFAYFLLRDLDIRGDYTEDLQLGDNRRIKQISVSLPALLGAYQDVQAILEYGGPTILPRGCSTIAISHGFNDSGMFQLDFNDGRYFPFEGISIDDTGKFTIKFPNSAVKQKATLLTLTDMILHFRYTIRSDNTQS